MTWITYKNKKPLETKTYLVSIKRHRPGGNNDFVCIAHYDIDKDQWYKYDPFDDFYEPKEKIDEDINQVKAWSDFEAYFSNRV